MHSTNELGLKSVLQRERERERDREREKRKGSHYKFETLQVAKFYSACLNAIIKSCRDGVLPELPLKTPTDNSLTFQGKCKTTPN